MKMAEKLNVHGIAIKAGLSLNRILYLPEELAKFAPTLNNVPIIRDHINLTDNTIGKVTNTAFNNATTEVSYEGWIKDNEGKGTIERVKDSRISEVSIGAVAGRLVRASEDDDFLIVKDLRALEISTTPTPATVGTSIKQALKGISEAKTVEDYKNVKPVSEQTAMINESFSMPKKQNKTEKKVSERFGVPLCEDDLPSVDDLRKHMKVHNEEPREVDFEEKANIKDKETEEIKMADDAKVTKEMEDKLKALETREAELKEKEEAISTKEKAVKEKEDSVTEKEEAIAKEKSEKLKEDYKALAEEKKIAPQDVSEKSDDVVEALIEQLKVIETEEETKEETKEDESKDSKEEKKEESTKEEKKDETKGKVDTGEDTEESADIEGYQVEKSEFGSGYAMYKENYDPKKYKRLGRV